MSGGALVTRGGGVYVHDFQAVYGIRMADRHGSRVGLTRPVLLPIRYQFRAAAGEVQPGELPRQRQDRRVVGARRRDLVFEFADEVEPPPPPERDPPSGLRGRPGDALEPARPPAAPRVGQVLGLVARPEVGPPVVQPVAVAVVDPRNPREEVVHPHRPAADLRPGVPPVLAPLVVTGGVPFVAADERQVGVVDVGHAALCEFELHPPTLARSGVTFNKCFSWLSRGPRPSSSPERPFGAPFRSVRTASGVGASVVRPLRKVLKQISYARRAAGMLEQIQGLFNEALFKESTALHAAAEPYVREASEGIFPPLSVLDVLWRAGLRKGFEGFGSILRLVGEGRAGP